MIKPGTADLLLPASHPARSLALATLASAAGFGAFTVTGAVFFVRSVGLSAEEVGTGLAAAGIAGVVGSAAAGRLADRWGARELFIAVALVQAALFAAYTAVHSFTLFVVVACLLGLAERAAGVVRSTIIATTVLGEERVRVKAYLRSVFNIGVSLGAAAAALPLQLDTRGAYLALLLGCAGTFLVAAAAGWHLPRVTPPRPGPGVAKVRAFTDVPYLAVAVLCGFLSIHHSLLVVALPIWVTSATDAPRSIVAGLLLLNTGLTIALQVWASRGADTVAGAGAAARRGAVLVGLACPLFAATTAVSGVSASGLLILGVGLLTLGELWISVAAWGLAFGLADSHAPGEYQSVFALGTSVDSVLGPLMATVIVLGLGVPGWLLAGAAFLLMAVTMPAVARWAHVRTVHGARHSRVTR